MQKNTYLFIALFAPAWAWGGQKPPAAPAASPAPPKGEPAGIEAPQAEIERFRAALKLVETSLDTQDILRGMEVLRSAYPKSRAVVVEGAQKGNPKVKCFALQLLGEKGQADQDLEPAVKALKDPHDKVRLAAVMAIRKLGPTGFKALAEHLPREKVANNRKMAVKTFQMWGDKAAVPVLARLLKTEDEQAVRSFLVTALEQLTRKKLGDDPAAWEKHVDDMLAEEQARNLLQNKHPKKDGGKL